MRCRTAGALHKFTEYKKKNQTKLFASCELFARWPEGGVALGAYPQLTTAPWCTLIVVSVFSSCVDGNLSLSRWGWGFFLLVVLKDGRIFDFITSDNDAHKSRSSSSTDGLPDRRSWTRQRIQFDWIEASRICVYDLPVEGCLLASHWRKSDWESRNGQRVCNGCYLSPPVLPFSFISRPLSCILNAPPLA